MNRKLGIIAACAAIILAVLMIDHYSDQKDANTPPVKTEQTVVVDAPEKKLFGLAVDSFKVERHIVQNGESFGNILLARGVEYPVIHQIANDFKEVFDVRMLRSGKPYSIFTEEHDSGEVAKYLVYESSAVDYIVFDLDKEVAVYPGKKKVTYKQRTISGEIESSLYESLLKKGGSANLAMGLSDIYAWSIDFFRIRPGDGFKVIYEEKYIDDTVSIGAGRILAADFYHNGISHYSFYFEKGEDYRDYFDEDGNTLRRAFLKAPLNFFRISSRYSKNRFHPVLKRRKAHLGTDYAAPRGTPIMSTANGEVIAAAYTRGNGNYVKVRHNSTYTTQYLHMTKFAKGIRKGTRVKQGEVIGYVGSTGLATGPHVCYRFWKNGKQVDPYKQDLPAADPIKKEYKMEYTEFMRLWKERLDKMDIQKEEDPSIYMASSGGA
jgi:murein DD-endopeptidase MepM/ murein hydrolase activator NlpD